MSMTKVLCAIAALPFLFGVALAETPKQSSAAAKQPMRLSDKRMDTVTAGLNIADINCPVCTLAGMGRITIFVPDGWVVPFSCSCSVTPHFLFPAPDVLPGTPQ